MSSGEHDVLPPAALGAPARAAFAADLLAQVRAALAPRYEVADVIGQGGMAVVFRARDPRHERDVAIKVVRPALSAGMAADRFLREIQLTAQLQHPNIVSLFDSGEVVGTVYYVMPLVQGESLRALVAREGLLSIELAQQLTHDLASALDYAHSRGVVHRDLKPENVLVSSGRAMLADFGIASVLERLVDQKSLTDAEIVVGTPAYMSPEQCGGATQVDGRSDIYSLGCVLYEMLAGEPPFTGRTVHAVMARHAGDRVPSIQVLRPDIPPHVVGVIEKALAKAPGDRYQTGSALTKALERPARPLPRVRPWVVAAGAVALAVALYVTLHGEPQRLDPNRVAIFPLVERGLSAAEGGAGAAAAVMISTALEHADPLRPLDVLDRLTREQQRDPGIISPADRAAIAREIGAARYVTGVVQAHGDSITVGLRLFDVATDSLVGQRSATGNRSSTPMHRLGIDAVKALLPSLVDPGRTIELAPLRDRRASAIALFIQGERAYRRSAFPQALGFYQRALADDSALVMAAIKGAMAASRADHRAAEQLARYAAQRDSLLPSRYAAFARGLDAYSMGRADSAEVWMLKAVQVAPDWPEALMQLGDVHFHLVPLRSALDSLAASYYFAAAAADSGFTPPLIHLAEIAVRRGDLPAAQGLIQRLAVSGLTPTLVAHLRMMYDCVTKGAQSYAWRSAVNADAYAALQAAKILSVAGHQLPCAEGAFRAVLAGGPDSLRWGAAFGLQSVLAAQQRTADVVSLIDSIAQAGTLQVAMTAYIIDLAAGLPVEKQAAAVAQFGQSRWGPQYAGLATARRLDWLQWLFGIWHARRGDAHILSSLYAALRTADAQDSHPATRLFADALAAQQALLRPDTTEAIKQLRNLNPAVPGDSLSWSMALPLAVERLQLAQLLLARGDYGGALDVASLFDHPKPMVYVAFLPASLTIRIRAAEALGRRRDAENFRAHLARVKQVAVAVQ